MVAVKWPEHFGSVFGERGGDGWGIAQRLGFGSNPESVLELEMWMADQQVIMLLDLTDADVRHHCPKCGSRMEEGFLLDFLGPTLWIKGPHERSFWSGTKVRGKTKRVVATYRCVDCGF